MSLAAKLNMTATIERPTPSTSDTGEVSLAWSQVETGVPCSLALVRARVELREPGVRRETSHVAYLPSGVDLRPTTHSGPGDRLLIEGVRYGVLHVEDVAGRGRYLKAQLRRQA